MKRNCQKLKFKKFWGMLVEFGGNLAILGRRVGRAKTKSQKVSRYAYNAEFGGI